jgi:hypothetical protein
MQPAIDTLAQRLRSAVLAADSSSAARLVDEYVQAIREMLPASSADLQTARELLTWVREMTIVQRTLTADQLAILDTAGRYTKTQAAQPTTYGIDLQA